MLSYTQISEWLRCQRAWEYKYRDGYRRKGSGNPWFMRGSLQHLGMQYAIETGGGGWDRALAEWYKEWGPAEELVLAENFISNMKEIVVGAYDIFQRDWEPLVDDHGTFTERRLEIDNNFVVIPDVVAERKTGPYAGGVFDVDFKSWSSPEKKTQWTSDYSLQTHLYRAVLARHGIPTIGSCLFALATDLPSPPRINKDGTPHATDVKTREKWSPVSAQWLTVDPIAMCHALYEQVVEAAHGHMAAGYFGLLESVPTFSEETCNRCDFREPCHARLSGHDESAILADQYHKRSH